MSIFSKKPIGLEVSDFDCLKDARNALRSANVSGQIITDAAEAQIGHAKTLVDLDRRIVAQLGVMADGLGIDENGQKRINLFA